MTKCTMVVIAAFVLGHAVVAAAADNSAGARTKSASFVPHSKSNHVYGTPIGRPVASHANASHHKSAPKGRSTSARRATVPTGQ
jgi:hypothetical protein